MTFCKQLKSATVGLDTVTAWELQDKFCAVPRYEITVDRDGIVHTVEKAAKTTWKKKFREMTA